MNAKIVAIDGVSGSGKSTIAKLLAEKVGFVHINSGALYRIVALSLRGKGIQSPFRECDIDDILAKINVDFKTDSSSSICLQLDNKDVEAKLYNEEIGAISSEIAVFGSVRLFVNNLLRSFVSRLNNVVIEGRDIGSAVFPEADVKLFLDASPEVRAARRARDEGSSSVSEIQKSLLDRDKRDVSREIDPLIAADDAVKIDTSCLSIEQVLEEAYLRVKKSMFADI